MSTDYKCVTEIGAVREYLAGHDLVSFDYETAPDAAYRMEEKAALDPAKAHICTMSLSVEEHTGIMIPVAHLTGTNMDADIFYQFLREFLTDKNITKICHNYVFESSFSYKNGIVIQPPVYDTICAAQMTLKAPGQFRKLSDSGLKTLALNLCKEPLPSFTAVTEGRNFDELDPADPETIRYSCADADFALRLYHICNNWFDRYLPNHRWIVENIESPTAVYLGVMKYNGVPIDAGYMAERQQEAGKEMARIREEIAAIIGPDVNIGSNCSTNDFKNCLFGTLGLPVMRVTASYKEAADDAVMIELKEWCDVHKPELSHLFELVQEYRKWNKIASTYITGYRKYIDPATGRIHPNFYALSTDTGRFSCNNPNLQNMPRKTNDPIGVRNFIKAPEGHAYYDSSNGNKDFKVYSKTFREEGADNQFFGVGFFPFNEYNEYYNCIHGRNFGGWHKVNGVPDDSNKEGHYDHHFGMEMKAEFTYLPGGKFNGNDISYYFSGDDDMWVYVDGVLVMDIGGIHNPVEGYINFRTGDVTVHGEAQENFKEKYKRITGKDWDDSDFSTHDFRVYYMERGGMYSNLEVTFNLPTFKTLALAKKLNGLTDTERAKYKDEVFTYEVVVNNELYNGSNTIRMNADGDVIEEGFTITDGQVTIKDGETVAITHLNQTDTFYVKEKSLDTEIFEEPHAERYYTDNDEVRHEEEITLTKSQTTGAATTVKDWTTPAYSLKDTEKVTFNNTLKEKDLEVEKEWNDEEDHSGVSITFKVNAQSYAEGVEPVDYLVDALKANSDSTTNDKVFTLNAANGWKTTIEHLPMVTPTSDGTKRIIYTVTETSAIEGYASTVQEIDPDQCNIDAVKLWPDDDADRTEVIQVKLKNKEGQYYAGLDENGDAIFNSTGQTYELKPDNDYTYRFQHVPVSAEENAYTLEEINDQNENTTGLVMYTREIINVKIINTPINEVNPDLPTPEVENHKRIDALRDGKSNPDTSLDEKEGEDLTDLYRLYLDYKVNSIQEPEGVDLLFIIDHSGKYEQYGIWRKCQPRTVGHERIERGGWCCR